MNRNFGRKYGTKNYKSIFVISTEGRCTEPQYFNIFRDRVVIKILCDEGSAPQHVLKRIKTYLKKSPLKKGDQAWVVIDMDEWSGQQIQPLVNWSRTNTQYKFALSNPNFEYWLLLHFENPRGIKSANECEEKLKKHLPDYDKKFDPDKLVDLIPLAIERARKQDKNRTTDWPETTGTMVYILIERIPKAIKN